MERVGKEEIILTDFMARNLFLEAVRYHMMPDKQTQLHSHRSQPRKPILKFQVNMMFLPPNSVNLKYCKIICVGIYYILTI